MAENPSNECKCCEGLSARTPVEIYNRPGLHAIRYRTGTHSRFKQSMVAGLSDPKRPGLSFLRTRDDDDFSVALIDAWAAVADVLTFYQERIAAESYLRTATEMESISQLSRLIGYRPKPGVASSACLAFFLETAEGAPESVSIDKGTKVQSIPGPGLMPSIFETVESITAWGSLNELKPPMKMRQDVTPSSEKVWFEGMSTGLKPGDGLLFNLEAEEEFFCQVESVKLLPEKNQTEVRIQKQLPLIQEKSKDARPFEDGKAVAGKGVYAKSIKAEDFLILDRLFPIFPAAILRGRVEAPRRGSAELPAGVTAFRSRAYIFGHNAPRFDSLPNIMKYGDYVMEKDKNDPNIVTYVFKDGPYRDREKSWVDTTLGNYHSQNDHHSQNGDPKGANIFLDGIYPVDKGGVIILRDGDICQPYTVDDFWDISKSDFTLTAKVRALALSASQASLEKFSTFSVRGTTVFCQGEELTLARVPCDVPCISGDSIVLDGYLYNLRKDQAIIVCGRLAMDLEENPYSCEPAVISEVQVTPGPNGNTAVSLKDMLKGKYLRDTVTVYANVALATEGETKEEVLGSGDASVPFQRFRLHFSPLTYVPSPSEGGLVSTLRVYVNGIEWREVMSLYECGPKDRVFEVQRDENGQATVKFGDGKCGSRLPTGVENVRAVYRKGLGRAGNVDAGKLSLPMKVPLGVKGVRNPMAASGGADSEDLESARTNAPLGMFTLGRLVSLQDYEDFARAFAGIGKAMAAWTWNGQTRGILVTVAGQGGDDVPTDGVLYKNLLSHMHKAGDPSIPVELMSYQKAFFRAAASVKVDPDYQADQVLSSVKNSVLARFSFNNRGFGQDVYLSEIMAAIQSVSGVTAVEVSRLYRVTATKEMKTAKCGEVPADIILSGEAGLETVIQASSPKSGDKLQLAAAAELLIIDQNQPFDYLEVIA